MPDRACRWGTPAATGASPRGEHALSLRLPGGPEAAAAARRALGRLRSELDAGVMDDLRLLVTELVANSVKHAGEREVALHVVVTAPSVWTEVTDRGPGFEPRPRADGQDEGSGWGLVLVDRLAERWGVVRDGDHTRVWFELTRG